MGKLFFSSLFGLLLCGQVAMADCTDWTGFYVGGQVGRGWSSTHWKYLNANPYDATGPGSPIISTTNKFHRSNVVGGGQIGFNYQYGWFVASLEAACTSGGFSYRKLNVVQSIFAPSQQFVKTDIPLFAMGMGRVGFLVHPDWMIYGKGGYSGARVKTSGQTFPPVPPLFLDWKTSKWHNGWVVGAGLEYRVSTLISVGAEYNYISLNSVTHVGAVSGGAIGPDNQVKHRVDGHLQTAMLRLNFIFW
jgi:outer membrane immunogenic protein